jgi:hypothetical protein
MELFDVSKCLNIIDDCQTSLELDVLKLRPHVVSVVQNMVYVPRVSGLGLGLIQASTVYSKLTLLDRDVELKHLAVGFHEFGVNRNVDNRLEFLKTFLGHGNDVKTRPWRLVV